MTLERGVGTSHVIVALLGIVAGCVSAYSFSLASFQNISTSAPSLLSYVPGLAFGIAVAIVYIFVEKRSTFRMLGAILIPLQGLIAYQIAHWITEVTTTHAVRGSYPVYGYYGNSDPTFMIAPLMATIGGFVATFLFVFLLHVVSGMLDRGKQMRLALYGALLGGVLIDGVLFNNPYTLPGESHLSFLGENPTLLPGVFIFFVGWQTIMLVLIVKYLFADAERVLHPKFTPELGHGATAPIVSITPALATTLAVLSSSRSSATPVVAPTSVSQTFSHYAIFIVILLIPLAIAAWIYLPEYIEDQISYKNPGNMESNYSTEKIAGVDSATFAHV